jgi:MFS family permease
LFRRHTFQTSIIGNLFARLGFGAVPFLLPLMLQISLGYTAELSGLLIAPIAFGVMVVKMIALPTLRRFGYKRTLIVNTVFVCLILWLFQTINSGSSVYYIALLTFVFGLLISLQYSGMNSLAYADLDTDDLSAATSIVGTTQQLAQSFGVAAAALLLNYYSLSVADHFVLTPEVFHQTFFAMGWLTLMTALVFIRLRPNDGHQMLKAPEAV